MEDLCGRRGAGGGARPDPGNGRVPAGGQRRSHPHGTYTSSETGHGNGIGVLKRRGRAEQGCNDYESECLSDGMTGDSSSLAPYDSPVLMRHLSLLARHLPHAPHA